ncbi:MAG: NAD-dependent epimerase/dehydratase family protein [Deltaproteobacteria bacterium]|nr:NAD-dependent epimerase/dehydratase family protein [Deltaproteobacteria bacterium]
MTAQTEEKAAKTPPKTVLVTGASGYLGKHLVHALAINPDGIKHILAADIREPAAGEREQNVTYVKADVRSLEISGIVKTHAVDTIVHLATIVTPPKGRSRDLAYSVDVIGTQNILNACIENRVEKIIITSSGAAYGYYADNTPLLTESDPIRGNRQFPYSYHKRLVEEMLAEYRAQYPQLKQIVFRPGTILGENVSNQITNLFEKKIVLGIKGAASPFVFIWDQDVVNCIRMGITENKEGTYNLAGDGTLTMKQIARILKRPYVEVSDTLLEKLFGLFQKMKGFQKNVKHSIPSIIGPVIMNFQLVQDMLTGFLPISLHPLVEKLHKAQNHLGQILPNQMGPLFELLDDNLPPYGPEQVVFLKYRPVLSNRKLKEEFGYTPLKTSEEVFRFYLAHKKSKKD